MVWLLSRHGVTAAFKAKRPGPEVAVVKFGETAFVGRRARAPERAGPPARICAGGRDVQLANDFGAWSFVPEWGASATYISTIIYGMLGFELDEQAPRAVQ